MREQFPGNGFEVNFICAPASSFFFLKKKIKVVMRLRRPGPADTVVEEQTRDLAGAGWARSAQLVQ